MTEPKPCPACKSLPHVFYNEVVWQCQCRNRDCPSAEATIGISHVARQGVVRNWNDVICPSVENKMKEEYYENTASD